MSLDVKEIRDKLGLPQGLFAEIFGVHPQTVSKWERGVLSPSPYQEILLKAIHSSLRYDPQLGGKIQTLLKFGRVAEAIYHLLRPSQR